ncbi:MAG: cell division protein ZipA C-terminal FtsZ-binding domain-containing protein [Halothiobacillus sp.]
MEWLRWVLLGVGLVALAVIAWAYLRHKSEQAIELGSGRTQANGDDPIDAQIRDQDIDEPLSAVRTTARPVELASPALEAANRSEPRIHLEPQSPKAEIEPFAIEPEPLRWQQPTFTRHSAAPDLFAHPHEADDTAHTDADGVIGAVRRTVLEHPLDAASSGQNNGQKNGSNNGQGGLFRQRQAPRFSYQEKQPVSAAGEQTQSPAAPSAPNPIVIPLFVASLEGVPFPGAEVENLIEELGFEFGAFSIFHYHSELGEPLFSLMNGINPGTFDRGNVSSFETPVLALFMQVPTGAVSETLVLDRMIDLARDIADHLGGAVLDDTREPLSSESIDRYREQLSS